ncbi:site-specific integrase [Rhodococcus qingshengii]|uniref:Core-binding (CB) domain-containing protein n=1 Tax=Rhodococcus qingshengii TaxID=334542 RepID=A0A2A5J050_RHOSG|nr:site-specific integrase [Rhodococcus qingshengii]PCK22617.1 hypothetical protein CHR55_31880 [Rhodococcus qingshengii]
MAWSVQRVVPPAGEESWTVLDPSHDVVAPVDRFLAHLSAVERSPATVRSYAFDLRDFVEFLDHVGVQWERVRLEDLGRFVNWLRLSPAERDGNVTSLPRLVDHCSASTVNRKLSAVGSFYQFHQRHGVECEFLWALRKGDGAVRPSQRPAASPRGLTTQQRERRDEEHRGTPRTARSGGPSRPGILTPRRRRSTHPGPVHRWIRANCLHFCIHSLCGQGAGSFFSRTWLERNATSRLKTASRAASGE